MTDTICEMYHHETDNKLIYFAIYHKVFEPQYFQMLEYWIWVNNTFLYFTAKGLKG